MTGTSLLVGVVGLLLCATMLTTVLRTQRPELAVGLSLAAGVLVVGLLLRQALTVVFRAAGVCFVTQLAADTCRDAGETALASKAELTGRVLLLLLTVPLFEQVLTMIIGVIHGQAVVG